VQIDVSFLASNRETKKILDTSEFQLRDHFIENLEPVLPAFALTDEGRAMLKEKLEIEVNQYLKDQEAPGFIEETHIIHILAH
jgi:flagellar basal body-associated protein FliL